MGNPVPPPEEVAQDIGPGGRPLGIVGIIVVTVALVAAALGLVVLLVAVWPTTTGQSGPLGAVLGLDGERSLLVVTTVSGGIGGVLHAVRSLYWYVGNRAARRSWLLFYVCVPLVGALLALIFYVVLRGGLLSSQVSATDVNPYGFCAVSALVGLFASEAVAKLKEIFSTLFSTAETGRDHVPPR